MPGLVSIESTYPIPGRILVADDDPTVRRALCSVLESRNYEVAEAESGEQAIQMVAAGHYELILMDVDMPGMSGSAACRCIRALEGDATGIPIVMVTASNEVDDLRAAMENDVSAYIIKPFAPSEVLRALDRCTR